MKRMFATTTVAVAMLGATACKGGAGDSVKLVPDAATVIGGVDVKALTSSKAYTDNKQLIEEGEAKEGLEAAKACNLGLDKWKTLTFGVDPSGGDKMVVVLDVDGIGKKENLECVAGKIKEKSQEDPWTMEDKDGKLTLSIDGGKLTGWAVSENTLVVASKDWTSAVQEMIDGKGKPAVDNSLKEVYARADTKKHVWVAGTVPDAMIKGTPAEGAKNVTGSVDLSSGLAILATVGFGTAEDATAKATELQTQFDGVKGMATGVGVPQPIVDSVKIEAKDTTVSIQASATEEDLKKVSELAKGAMGGAGAGGAPPPAPVPEPEAVPAEPPPAE